MSGVKTDAQFRRKYFPKSCKGWNFHVYALGATKCSICGARRD